MALNEKKFYKALEDIFVGAPIEGEGGYVNLLSIKQKYYSKVIDSLKDDIEKNPIITDSFKEDFYNLLYTFFEKYFSECGSVYFAKTANWQNVYEKVYTDTKDVVLFWKTHMLYYVKSDILFKSIYVKSKEKDEDTQYVFYFDVGELQQKQNNEKKELVFSYKETKTGKVADVHDETTGDKTFVLSVNYSERGRKTDYKTLVKSTGLNEEIIEKAINTFKKQTTVDFFINKNAKAFLEEQLDLFLHQLMLEDESVFEQERLNQIKTVKKYAKDIIAFISQFENELVRIWNKPKFVKNSNYVISFKTLKQILTTEQYDLFKKSYLNIIRNNPECRNDIEEIIRETYKRPLQKLYVSDFNYNYDTAIITFSYFRLFNDEVDAKEYANENNTVLLNEAINDKGVKLDGYFAGYQNKLGYKSSLSLDEIFADTQYLKCNEKIDLLSNINDIDSHINGYLIQSDNYQFLRSASKFKNRVSMVYIDPPFNTLTEGFAYLDGLKDTTWLSQMNDRFKILYNDYLKADASLYVHGDYHCNYYMRYLLDNIAGEENFNREIIWNTSPAISGQKAGPKIKNYIRQHDTILYYLKGKPVFNKSYRPYKNKIDVRKITGWLDLFKSDDTTFFYQYDSNNNLVKKECNDISVMANGDVWNDIFSMMYSQNMTRENWGKSNTQKPENLLRRLIQVSTNFDDTVMDVFVGSGTTVAAAHKLGRKWIGVDSGDFLQDIVIKRMKSVVMGDFMPKLSEDLHWQGGGFFKYYELEQYEDALNKAVYSDDNDSIYSNNAFTQYVFFADKKLTDVLDVSKDEFEINFDTLYENIDLPETISLLYGEPIERITEDEVKLVNVTKPIKYNVQKMNNEEKIEFVKMLKPLLWWGE